MRVLRPSSPEEYALWYLRRESRKGDLSPIPENSCEQVQAMWNRHGDGKMRVWFTNSTRWCIVLLDDSEFGNLVFLESVWTKKEGIGIPGELDYRILDRVGENSISSGYLARPSAQKHKAYYERLPAGSLHLSGLDRIAICSAED